MKEQNLKVKKKIEKYESLDESLKNDPPICSIVITAPKNEDKNANRLSIASVSSAESARSDNIHETVVEKGHPTSTFYVDWD